MSTTTTYTGVRIVDMPDLGAVNDASSFVGERAGSGRFSAPALRSYLINQNAPANVRDFGAAGDGSTDDTAAIQAAINTGRAVYLPAGNYRITAQLNFNTQGQHICGDGRQRTFIVVTAPSAGFSNAVLAVNVNGGTGDASVHFCEFCVSLAQPDTSNRASLNGYPPVFLLYQAPRCEIVNVRLVGGIDGLFMEKNCGGFRGSGIDFGCFNRNIYIDGNLDLTSFTDCEVWPFSATGIMTPNQQQIFYQSTTYGIYSLRNDYLVWTGGLFLVGTSGYFGMGTDATYPGPTYGSFNGTGFDTYSNLNVNAGNILTDNCVFSVQGGATNPTSAISHQGGVMAVRGAKFFVGSLPALNATLIASNVASGDAVLIVESCHFELGSVDQRALYVDPGPDADLSLIISGNKFDRSPTGAYTTSMVEINAGAGAITGNIASRWAGATGATSWLAINDLVAPITVAGNQGNGWVITIIGSTVASGNLLTIPPVFGTGMPFVFLTGSTTIGGMTYAGVGVRASFAGQIVTLIFPGAITVSSGTVGTAGQFILNGRTNFVSGGGSSLTVQLTPAGNWQEIGRCA